MLLSALCKISNLTFPPFQVVLDVTSSDTKITSQYEFSLFRLFYVALMAYVERLKGSYGKQCMSDLNEKAMPTFRKAQKYNTKRVFDGIVRF